MSRMPARLEKRGVGGESNIQRLTTIVSQRRWRRPGDAQVKAGLHRWVSEDRSDSNVTSQLRERPARKAVQRVGGMTASRQGWLVLSRSLPSPSAALVARPRTHLIRYHGVKLRASCPTPCGSAFGCSKSLPAILSHPMRAIVPWWCRACSHARHAQTSPRPVPHPAR